MCVWISAPKLRSEPFFCLFYQFMFHSVEFAFIKKLLLYSNEDIKTHKTIMALDQDVCNIQNEKPIHSSGRNIM